MESEGVAARRRVLVEALAMCLERSKVCEVVDAQTLRSVLTSAATEMWREGEFRLETAWKILCNQPGLSAKEVAPPLLVFKAYEDELGVQVRVPQALSALPRGEQVRLRDELGIKREDFAKSIDALKALNEHDQERERVQEIARAASEDAGDPPAVAPPPDEAQTARKRRRLAAVLGAFALVSVATSTFIVLRSSQRPADLDGFAKLLKLSAGTRTDQSLVARIDDPAWTRLTREEQQKLAEGLFDVAWAQGIRAMTLVAPDGRQRVIASDVGDGKRVVMVR